MSSAEDHEYMSRALKLAKKGLYTAMPNPRVGCVIVKNGKVVGTGFHEKTGEPHAEVYALRMAAEQARGATAYVTLEPCSYFGRTPPCAEELIKAGVHRVVAAMEDPNPEVSGRGMKKLSEAGIEICTGVLESEARALNKGFIQRMMSGRPYVRAKMAMSIDGRTAMANGESQWITGPEARAEVQHLRAQSCAIITGIGSILHDNSSLTVRASELNLPDAEALSVRQPLRVVLDSALQTPIDSNVVVGAGQSLIVGAVEACEIKKKALEAAGAEVLQLDSHHGQINLEQLLELLGQRGCNEVLLEAGATLAGSMVKRNLVDEFVVFMAPLLMGSEARPLFQLPLGSLSEKINLNIQDIRAVGSDWKITATVQ